MISLSRMALSFRKKESYRNFAHFSSSKFSVFSISFKSWSPVNWLVSSHKYVKENYKEKTRGRLFVFLFGDCTVYIAVTSQFRKPKSSETSPPVSFEFVNASVKQSAWGHVFLACMAPYRFVVLYKNDWQSISQRYIYIYTYIYIYIYIYI